MGRGCGAPDISLLPLLSDTLGVDREALLKGMLEENDMRNGNMKKLKFYICSECGNPMFAMDDAAICCCGQKTAPLSAQNVEPGHSLKITGDASQWYIAAGHRMRRKRHIFLPALSAGDALVLKRQHPEWELETRLPFPAHGALFRYCTQHGPFCQGVRA